MDDTRIKANLQIRLYANNLLVANTDDPVLWQRVLACITTGETPNIDVRPQGPTDVPDIRHSNQTPASRLAQQLELPATTIQAALAPSDDPPFLHLDARTWEAFTKNFPSRGRHSVPGIVLALTALALWLEHLEKDPPTIADGKAVLRTINVEGSNLPRSVDNCDWLQRRNEGVSISPAEISAATRVVQAYCTKKPLAHDGLGGSKRKPRPRQSRKAAQRKRASTPSSGRVARSDDELLGLVHHIQAIDESTDLGEKVLSQRAQLPRILMCVYYAAKCYADDPYLTTGEIETVTDQLGVRIDSSNASKVLKNYTTYVTADAMRKPGAIVGYKLNRNGISYFENLLGSVEE